MLAMFRLKHFLMDIKIFLFVMLALPYVMAEQMDWGDNPDLVEEANTIEGRENYKIMVVIEGENIDMECQVLSTSEPVSEIAWKIDGKEVKPEEKPTLSYAYGEVFMQSYFKMSSISRDRDGSTVSCNYARGQYGGSVRAVLAVFKMEICQAGHGKVRITFMEAGRKSPRETYVEDRIKAKISKIMGKIKIMTENNEYSVTVPYRRLEQNKNLINLQPWLSQAKKDACTTTNITPTSVTPDSPDSPDSADSTRLPTSREPRPADCQKFYQCDGGQTAEQTCGEGTVRNEVAKVCDWSVNEHKLSYLNKLGLSFGPSSGHD
eukprot:GFUD01084565.1.p1 GENE.GFUD01084565.1~~GFUD01084565.1.p1  ORF type:complete len:320 (-),score=90.03 GFUD01084565.1:6-965(-)